MSDTEDTDDDSFQSVNNEEIDVYETDEENDEGSGWLTLNGCNKITRWQYPENETRCTEINCSLECGNRFAAIEHYKEKHAANMILCYICDAPIYAKVPDEFERHYIENHPTVAMPFIFNSTSSLPKQEETEIYEDASEKDQEDDLIRLSGCGKITCWLFPKHQQVCPIESCDMQFMSRSDAIQHYRDQHSNNSIFCYLCEKPILALQSNDFEQHYVEEHPNIEMAFCFDEKSTPNAKRKQSTDGKKTKAKKHSNVKCQLSNGDGDDKQQNDDDNLTLNGCGYITHWKISQTDWNRCPIINCKKTFKLRSHAILHFKKQHASDSICCTICNKPVLAQNFSEFIEHYENHGEKDLIILRGCGQISQWRFPQTKRCPVRGCAMEYTSRPNAIAHYKSQHAEKSIYCGLCDRPYVMKHAHHFIQHFRSQHTNAAMPYHFNAKQHSFSYEDTKPDQEDVIQLRGCGEITYWTFPKTEWQKCQISNCYTTFKSRSDAITHFKLYHTENFILCSICNKPIRANYPVYFKVHHRTYHPNVKIPYEFNNGKYRKRKKNPTTDIAFENDNDDGANDDLITLSGCGYITQWQFPKNLTKCPLKRYCGEEFTTRKALIAHYKEKHSDKSILCPKCNKPISVVKKKSFIIHNRRIHPNEPLPWSIDFEKSTKTRTVKPVAQNEQNNDIITLTGGGIRTFWRFPKSLTKCPMLRCRMEFNTQSKAVAHFKKLHASGSIHCSTCDRPIRSQQYVTDFVSHHIRMHPKIKLPYGIIVNKNQSKNKEVPVEKDPNEDNCVADVNDDMIALNGWGQITYWQYPKQSSQCPVQNCRKSFKLRLTAIAHYKKQHSQSAILCSLCNKPICVNMIDAFEIHHHRVHPGVEVPSEFTAKSLRYTRRAVQWEPLQSNDGVIENEHDDGDDMIVLRGRGNISKWLFPNTTQCPVMNCRLKFNSRSAAIAHYRSKHAGHYMMCTTCKKPISVANNSNWKVHCLTHKQTCNKQNRNVRASNTDEVQSGRSIACPLKDCRFRPTTEHMLRTHWNQKHDNLRFPEIREGNGFGYSINQFNQTIVSKDKRQTEQMNSDANDSLLKPLSTDSSSCDESQHSNKIMQKQPKKLKCRDRNKRQRAMHYGNNSTCNDSSDEEELPNKRKRKLAIERDEDMIDGAGGVIPKCEWPIKTEVLSEMDELSPSESSFVDTSQQMQIGNLNEQLPNSYLSELNTLNTDSTSIPKIIDVKSINMNQDPRVTSNVQIEKRFQATPVTERRNSC